MSVSFDRITRPYRWLEYLTLGRALERCRTHFLPQVVDRGNALVLGDGDGRFLAAFMIANPLLQATAVDTSATMLALLRTRCEKAVPEARLTLRHGSALEHEPSPDTDLIIAHFFFDCLVQDELDALIANLAGHTQSNAIWLISDFRTPDGLMRVPGRLLVRALYLAFRILTGLQTNQLPNYEEPLRAAGLVRVGQHLSLAGLLTTELWRRPVHERL